MAYCLKLSHRMKQLHPVFNVVKLTLALDDPITGWKTEDHPLPIVINREVEWEVEEILDSHWHQRRFQYLIKWKRYSCELSGTCGAGAELLRNERDSTTKSGGTTLASACALCLDRLSRVWLHILGGLNCCQESLRGVV